MAKQLPERVGLSESFWPHIIDNAWGRQGIEPGTDLIERFNLDLRGTVGFSVPGPRPDLACVVEETDGWIVNRDGWGASFKTWKHKAGTPEHVGFSVTSQQVWQRGYRGALEAIDVRDHVNLEPIRQRYTEAMAD